MNPNEDNGAGCPMIGFGKKRRIFRESVKDQHTSHWDLDLLSTAELAELMASQPGIERQNVTPKRAEQRVLGESGESSARRDTKTPGQNSDEV